ncbi:uncharacterized protein LOC129905915 isoform X1 [Episyrphus balteatus]|uniref:uncharacterized protein LOC129905915 isoform X1 n=1 Tax=Episyrphus balteatus TaxID=286459 RepID=UPI0024856EE2|nr:uncharacterized protein LOC129905915 isoform X1 [Episyrphus balteatus]
MKIYQIIPLFAILSRFGDSDANKFNISYAQLDTCKEYTIASGYYKYKDFFQISSMNNTKLEDDQRLHLKFFVMTRKDAHILLSEFENQSYSDPFYEIVLGCDNNNRSDIRLKYENYVAHVKTPNFLSTFDPMPIEIIQKNDGQLVINIPGFAEPYLNYSDKNPLNIRFVSFSSWGGTSAKWFYDCKLEELTNSEKCQCYQSTEKNEFNRPTTTTNENPVDSPYKFTETPETSKSVPTTKSNKLTEAPNQENSVGRPSKSTEPLEQENRVVKDTDGKDLKNKTDKEVKQSENLLRETSVHHYVLGSILLVASIAVGTGMAIYYKSKHRAVVSSVEFAVR